MVTVIQSGFGGFRTVQRSGRSGTAQQVAVHVQDGNGIGREALYGGRHQVVNGLHVLRRETAARTEFHQDAGLGRLLRIEKHGILGEGDVDARLLHRRDRHRSSSPSSARR